MKLFEITDTKTKVQDTLFHDALDELLRSAQQHDIAISPKQQRDIEAKLKQEIASGTKTREKISKMKSLSPDQLHKAATHLADLMLSDLTDEVSDEDAAGMAGVEYGQPEVPRTPENLPAVINKQLSTKRGVEVEWSMVKHLPGYLQQPIRSLGRHVFKAFTSTPIEKIQVLAHLNDAGGPNDEVELKAVASFLKRHGIKDTRATLNFEKIMPGYDAEVAVYHAEGYTFMVVEDFAGHYIYAWPSKTSKMEHKTKRIH